MCDARGKGDGLHLHFIHGGGSDLGYTIEYYRSIIRPPEILWDTGWYMKNSVF